MTRAEFTVLLACPDCLSLGAAVWEENAHTSAAGPERRLVTLHGNFHTETGRTQSGDPVIVCSVCDTIQLD